MEFYMDHTQKHEDSSRASPNLWTSQLRGVFSIENKRQNMNKGTPSLYISCNKFPIENNSAVEAGLEPETSSSMGNIVITEPNSRTI